MYRGTDTTQAGRPLEASEWCHVLVAPGPRGLDPPLFGCSFESPDSLPARAVPMDVRPTLITDVRQLPASSGVSISARRWSVSLSIGALPSGALSVIMSRLARCIGVIEHLRLNGLTDAGALALHRALSRARGAVHVLDADFSDSRVLSDAGAGALAACVAEGIFRRSLSLARCERVGHFGIFAVAAALPLGTLRALDVSACAGAGGAGACALAAALSSAPSLESLVLTDTDVGEEGMVALAAALAHAHVRLRELDISRGGVGSTGVRALASALAVGASFLERLLMDDSDVGDAGAASFAAALSVRCRRGSRRGSPTASDAATGAPHSQLLPLSISMRGGRVCDAGATDFAGIYRLKISGETNGGANGVGGSVGGGALGDIDVADVRTPLSASVALTLIASARRVGARAIVSVGVLNEKSAAALSSPFGIALSLGGGGGGSDFNNGLTGSARVRVLQESWTGEGLGEAVTLPPSAAALKEAASAAVRAGARALASGRELERGGGGGGGGDGGGGRASPYVDHSLIASLVRARTAPPRVSVDLALLSSSTAADALVECSDEDDDNDDDNDDDVGSEDGSSGKMGGGKKEKGGGASKAAAAVGGVGMGRGAIVASGPRGGAVSPVSENLAAMLPSSLLATPLDSLTREQLDAVLALARTLQKDGENTTNAVPLALTASATDNKSRKVARSPLPAPPPLPTVPVPLALPPAPPPPPLSTRAPSQSQRVSPPPPPTNPLKRQVPGVVVNSTSRASIAAPVGMHFVGGGGASSLAEAPRAPAGAQSPLPLPRRSTIGRSRGALAAAEAASGAAPRAQPQPPPGPPPTSLKTNDLGLVPSPPAGMRGANAGGHGYAAIAAAAAAARLSPHAGGSYARSFSAATSALPASPPPSSAESSRPTSPDAWLYGGPLLDITSES